MTFTRVTQTYTPATDAATPVTTTITGDAIQTRGDWKQYKALNLVPYEMPNLFFTPTTYGLHAGTTEFVMPGDTVIWATKTWTVKGVRPIAPDGIVIAAHIIIGA